MNRTTRMSTGLAVTVAALFAATASAQMMPKKEYSPLERLATVKEALSPPASTALLEQTSAGLAANVPSSWNSFQSAVGGTWVAYVDKRSGLLDFAEGSGWAWIPGVGNQLSKADIAEYLAGADEVDLATLDRIARANLPTVGPLLGVTDAELKLSSGRSGKMADYLWYVDYDVYRGGWKIEGARVMFRINHGNVVQFGSEGVPPAGLAVPFPRLSREEAVQAVATYVGGFTAADGLVDAGSLKMMTRAKIDPAAADRFRPGDGYGLLPIWEVSFRRKETIGTWRARVDALTGKVVEFGDVNEYAQAKQGVVLVQPSLGETSKPMPFTNISTGGFTNSAGVYTPAGAATSSMNGQYVRPVDTCGAISLAADGMNNFDFGTSPASDCSTPGFGGAGNTRSSRTQFYWVNRVKEVGRGWLPAVAWLSAQLTTNVNLNQVCNAYWNGSTLNYFRSGGGCGNTGELPSVSLHEYGHGLDSNDGTGAPPENGSGETVGDWFASLATHLSCIGSGFLGSNCGGYGNACTACTGVRDIDWAKHAANTPSTVQNFTQPTCPAPSAARPTYVGPCGQNAISLGAPLAGRREGHCESYISSQALWDLAARDLPSPGSGGAWTISDRLWYLTRATTTSFFACNTAPATWTSDGCAAGTLFRTYRVADDDDGNLANGTPHGGAIFAAFNRHNIACASDPGANVTFAACTIPSSPTLSLTPSNNTMQLSWSNSGAGVVYDVYRNELDCNAGFIKVANDVATTTFNDPNTANFFNYNYQIVAHPTGTEACGAPPSNCATAAPLPCTAPASPTIGTATASAPNQITVSWTNGSPASDFFNVYRAVGTCAAPGPFTQVATMLAGSPYVDNTVSGGTTYAYRIAGTETTGVCESAQTTCVQATATGVCTLAPTFAGITSATNNATSTCSVGLTWGAGTAQCAGPVTYNVYRSTTAGFTPMVGNRIAAGVSGTSFNDPGPLANGTTYYYKVRAVDAGNSSEDTNTVEQSTAPTGPIAMGTFTETFEGPGGFDNVGWTHAAVVGANDWTLSTAQSQTPTHSWNSTSVTTAADRVLVSPAFIASGTTTLSFWHTFALEQSTTPTTCFDGGTLETSIDGGMTWVTIPDAAITAGPFIGTVSSSFSSPIAGKRAWCGNTAIGPFSQVTVNLAAFSGQTVKLRWREGDDSSVARIGWFVDSVTLTNAGTASVCAMPVGLSGFSVD